MTYAGEKKGDMILGLWFTEENKSKVEIYETQNIYKGKFIWLKKEMDEGKAVLDSENPDPKEKNKPLIGKEFVWNFRFDSGANKWVDGRIYNPEDGKTYMCSLSLEKDGRLLVRGSIDAWGLLGKTQFWTRVK